jgi:hypothetical protein
MASRTLLIGLLTALASPLLLAQASPPTPQPPPATPPAGVDLTADEAPSLREALGRAADRVDDWIDRFTLSGFVAGRYFDTDRGGARPDGALGIQAATLFVDVGVRDLARAFFELRFDYFQEAGNNEMSLGEAYLQLHDVLRLSDSTHLQLKVGRFDLPFGEWYLLEDPNRNRMIGFPAVIPYRWDEGVLGFADFGSWGFTAAISDGTYSRNSQSGVAPATTLRLHARPADGLYVSASGLYIHEADASAVCFGGSVITPVAGGAAGASPSSEVRSSLASVDLIWQATNELHVQGMAGSGLIDDPVSSFDRTIWWWAIEGSYTFAPHWATTVRWSGVGTFDETKGYAFEARPYGNGVASYGFDLSNLQRVAVGLRHDFAKELTAKIEVGFDHFEATDLSGLRNDTRPFTAAELVLTF